MGRREKDNLAGGVIAQWLTESELDLKDCVSSLLL